MIRAHSAAPFRRLLVGVAVAGLTVGIAACGGDDDDDTSLPTESVATTVETTTAPDDTVTDTTVPAPRTTTTATSNSGSGSESSGSGSGNSGTGSSNADGGYARSSSRYSEADSLEIASPLADGVYGARATSDGTTITFVLFRYISGPTCAEGLTEDEANTACASPPLVEEGDGTELTVVGEDLDEATVIMGYNPNDAWLVDGAELARLIAGEAPAADAPAGYEFIDYDYRIIVEDGEVVAADQQWHS